MPKFCVQVPSYMKCPMRKGTSFLKSWIFRKVSYSGHSTIAKHTKYWDTELPQHWIEREGPRAWSTRSLDLPTLELFMWASLKNYVLSVQIQSLLSYINSMIVQPIAAVNTKTLETVCKNINSRINHAIRVNGVQIEKHNIEIKLLEYFYYDTYWNQESKEYSFTKKFRPAQRLFADPVIISIFRVFFLIVFSFDMIVQLWPQGFGASGFMRVAFSDLSMGKQINKSTNILKWTNILTMVSLWASRYIFQSVWQFIQGGAKRTVQKFFRPKWYYQSS